MEINETDLSNLSNREKIVFYLVGFLSQCKSASSLK